METKLPELINSLPHPDRFNLSKHWKASDGWRGHEVYDFAIAGANDTGTAPDSPCPSPVATRELKGVKQMLHKAGISYRETSGQSSNIFMVSRFILVKPVDYIKALELFDEYYVTAKNETQLLYKA